MLIPLRDTNPPLRRPYVTYTLIVLNVAIFLFERLVANLDGLAFYEDRLLSLELSGFTGLLTYQFLHGGWGHLIFNMWFLFIFGDNVEASFGPGRFLLFYLATGVGAALFEVFLDPSFGAAAPGILIGASGSISGVLGAYWLRYPKARILTWTLFVLFVEIRAFWFLGIWILLQFFYQFSGSEGVAYMAHIGGFICGLIIYRLHHTFRMKHRG